MKNIRKGIEEYEKNGPQKPAYERMPIAKPTDELLGKIARLKDKE